MSPLLRKAHRSPLPPEQSLNYSVCGLRQPCQPHIPQISSRCLVSAAQTSSFLLTPSLLAGSPISDAPCSFCCLSPGPPTPGLPLAPPEKTSPAPLYCFIHEQILIEISISSASICGVSLLGRLFCLMLR